MKVGFINNLYFGSASQKEISKAEFIPETVEASAQEALCSTGRAHVNLQRRCKNRMHTTQELDHILPHISDNDRFMGALPYDWIKDIPKDKIGDKTGEIMEIFQDLAISHSFALNEECDINALFGIFKKRFQAALGKDIKIYYLNEGEVGMVYRLRVDDKDYALKLFKNSGMRNVHGKTIEFPTQISFCHATKPKSRAQFYFGKIAGENDNDGFIVSEFVQEDYLSRSKKSALEFSRFCIGDDKEENYVGGKTVDFGGIRQVYKNSKMAKELHRIARTDDIEGFKAMVQQYGENKVFAQTVKYFADSIIFEDEEITEKHNEIFGEMTDYLLEYRRSHRPRA